MAFAEDHLTNQIPAMSSLATICLIGIPLLDRAKIVALVSSRRKGILHTAGAGYTEQFWIDCCRPDRARISRIDLRMASRQARLAFSIKCQ
ncbi:hypothetical protein [Bradyrhizobium yuanmingense]|uniref:hypothetical protein n=1 Tax=Bradyrhizobium yuanmingense TaxID=108015 RepID=UPI0023B9881C|nr:hypothetical protein [Bradyrhizobium yuanmingense]MDF0497195.1 hypothetical protein [Bradyrhizobium yuanmingense]